MRQLFRSYILPIIDYATSAQFSLDQRSILRLYYVLEKVQRIGARAILRVQIAIALPILEAEAYIKDTKARLTRKVTIYAIKVLILLIDNSVRKTAVRVQSIRRYASPLSTILAIAVGTIRNIVVRPLLKNPPQVYTTQEGLRNKVVVAEKDQAIRDADSIAKVGIACLYPDALVITRCVAIVVARR